ncbi:hypothetical protein JL09_g6803, partial [Pichia kudriavzevii]
MENTSMTKRSISTTTDENYETDNPNTSPKSNPGTFSATTNPHKQSSAHFNENDEDHDEDFGVPMKRVASSKSSKASKPRPH